MLFNNRKQLELEAKCDELQDIIQQLKQENAGYKHSLASTVGLRANYDAELVSVSKKHALELDSLKQELEQERISVNRKVNKALADIGVKQFAPEAISQTQETSPQAIYNKFIMMANGPAKDSYYKEHEKTLSAVTGLHTL